MEVKTLRFYEDFAEDIRDGTKTQTIRYNWTKIPDEGQIMNAVSSQEGDVFAKIRITSTEQLTMQECVNRELDGHVNYDTVEEMVSEMSQYYSSISEDDVVTLFNFEMVEWLRD